MSYMEHLAKVIKNIMLYTLLEQILKKALLLVSKELVSIQVKQFHA